MATLPYAVVQRKHKNKGSSEVRLSEHSGNRYCRILFIEMGKNELLRVQHRVYKNLRQ